MRVYEEPGFCCLGHPYDQDRVIPAPSFPETASNQALRGSPLQVWCLLGGEIDPEYSDAGPFAKRTRKGLGLWGLGFRSLGSGLLGSRGFYSLGFRS